MKYIVVLRRQAHVYRSAMERVTTIGLDIVKSTFQVHGLDASGEVTCGDV